MKLLLLLSLVFVVQAVPLELIGVWDFNITTTTVLCNGVRTCINSPVTYNWQCTITTDGFMYCDNTGPPQPHGACPTTSDALTVQRPQVFLGLYFVSYENNTLVADDGDAFYYMYLDINTGTAIEAFNSTTSFLPLGDETAYCNASGVSVVFMHATKHYVPPASIVGRYRLLADTHRVACGYSIVNISQVFTDDIFFTIDEYGVIMYNQLDVAVPGMCNDVFTIISSTSLISCSYVISYNESQILELGSTYSSFRMYIYFPVSNGTFNGIISEGAVITGTETPQYDPFYSTYTGYKLPVPSSDLVGFYDLKIESHAYVCQNGSKYCSSVPHTINATMDIGSNGILSINTADRSVDEACTDAAFTLPATSGRIIYYDANVISIVSSWFRIDFHMTGPGRAAFAVGYYQNIGFSSLPLVASDPLFCNDTIHSYNISMIKRPGVPSQLVGEWYLNLETKRAMCASDYTFVELDNPHTIDAVLVISADGELHLRTFGAMLDVRCTNGTPSVAFSMDTFHGQYLSYQNGLLRFTEEYNGEIFMSMFVNITDGVMHGVLGYNDDFVPVDVTGNEAVSYNVTTKTSYDVFRSHPNTPITNSNIAGVYDITWQSRIVVMDCINQSQIVHENFTVYENGTVSALRHDVTLNKGFGDTGEISLMSQRGDLYIIKYGNCTDYCTLMPIRITRSAGTITFKYGLFLYKNVAPNSDDVMCNPDPSLYMINVGTTPDPHYVEQASSASHIVPILWLLILVLYQI